LERPACLFSAGVDVAQVDDIEPAVRGGKAVLWQIDQIERDPLRSGHTSRRWGVGIKKQDGSIVVERDPWDE
jgi:hypothetical protein